MRIRFKFDLRKSIQAMAYLTRRLGEVEKVKLMKLLYLADRKHFIDHGYPITGDSQWAMPYGPVPSLSFDALNGESWPQQGEALRFLEVCGYVVRIKGDPGTDALAQAELATLEAVITEHGGTDQWALVDELHESPEYKAVNVEGTSTPIPYELILKLFGSERHFRRGRPVISPEMAAHMLCPFSGREVEV